MTFKSKPKPITGSGASKATAIAQAKRAGASVAIEKKCKCPLYVRTSPRGESACAHWMRIALNRVKSIGD